MWHKHHRTVGLGSDLEVTGSGHILLGCTTLKKTGSPVMPSVSILEFCCLRREGNYAIFGHSMGAWIAWEMLQEITRRGLPLPVRLFVSGNRWERPAVITTA